MKTYTVKNINKHKPCYNPTRHFDPDKSYTLLDFLEHETCPDGDKIWVVTRFLDDKTNRLFAVWCARRALSRVDNPDERAVHAVGIAEKYARGEATEEELRSAHDEVYKARDKARDNSGVAYWTWNVCVTALHSASWAAHWAAHWLNYDQGNRVSERKKQIEYLKSICEGVQ